MSNHFLPGELLIKQNGSTDNTDRLAIVPDSGTVSDLRVDLVVAPGGGERVTFTLRKDTGGGPVATALTCEIRNNATRY
jgi:hypothetical protein